MIEIQELGAFKARSEVVLMVSSLGGRQAGEKNSSHFKLRDGENAACFKRSGGGLRFA